MKIYLLSDMRGIFQQRTPFRSDGNILLEAEADCIIVNGVGYKDGKIQLKEGENKITVAIGAQRYRVESLIYKDGVVIIGSIIGTEEEYKRLSIHYEKLKARLSEVEKATEEIKINIAGEPLF